MSFEHAAEQNVLGIETAVAHAELSRQARANLVRFCRKDDSDTTRAIVRSDTYALEEWCVSCGYEMTS